MEKAAREKKIKVEKVARKRERKIKAEGEEGGQREKDKG